MIYGRVDMEYYRQESSTRKWTQKRFLRSFLFVASAIFVASSTKGSQAYTPDESFQKEIASLRSRIHSQEAINATINDLMKEKINILFIMTDQQRFDMIGSVQKQMSHYDGKTKINTPNLDKLMKEGTSFMRHYTQCPVCAPARSTLSTGCTIERTGVQTNDLVKEDVYNLDSQLFGEKIEAMRSFDQILSEERGYVCEYYGKWHQPKNLYYQSGSGIKQQSIRYNAYNYEQNTPIFDDGINVHEQLEACLDASKYKLRKNINGTEQINTFNDYPYTPTKIDSRYGYPGGTPLKPKNKGGKFEKWQTSQNCVIGRDSLEKEYTSTYCLATPALNAMDRLISENQPWSLTVSFNSPHPPMVSTGEYFDKYWRLKDNFFVPPSIDVAHMTNTAYKPDKNPKVQDEVAVKEWMASYYALVEEVDHHVGRLLQKLAEADQTKNTLVIFTSDHGESLGAHGRKGKTTFFEESVHVPLMLRLPGKIPEGRQIDIPTSSMDIFSTILDYAGSKMYDKSDGKSLRRFIEETNHNNAHDNECVVSEWDYREPTGNGDLTGSLGSTPNFMVVKDNWKLMIPKYAESPLKDQLYNIDLDPFEMNNLLGNNGLSASDEIIGKAEHLKALLHGWMERMDGKKSLYSNPIFNAGEGRGDMVEVNLRRTWKHLPIWISDSTLVMGKPALLGSTYVRNEFIYIGRTTKGTIKVHSIALEGRDSHLFSLSGFLAGDIKAETHKRVKVAFQSNLNELAILDVQIRISISEGEDILVKIQGYRSDGKGRYEEKDKPVDISYEFF